MNGRNDQPEQPKAKRDYVKPRVQKHVAATLVSGKKKNDDDCLYSSKLFITTYYH